MPSKAVKMWYTCIIPKLPKFKDNSLFSFVDQTEHICPHAESNSCIYSGLLLHFPFGGVICSNNDVKPPPQVLEIRWKFHALFITSSVGSGHRNKSHSRAFKHRLGRDDTEISAALTSCETSQNWDGFNGYSPPTTFYWKSCDIKINLLTRLPAERSSNK